ncbi:MAG: hypothetical protein IMZ55_16800, partial [Acidobacteria bacterium]|nr:hypothetical protein [Acidobacteriota bacterium]
PWAAVLQRECAGTTRTGATALDKACVEALQGEALSVAAFEQQVTANTLGVLTDIVERLGEIEGPKTLVLLSEGLVVGGERVGQDSQVGTASQVGQAAYKARVNIYVLQLDRAFLDSFSVEYRTPPLSAGAEGQVMAAGLETLAGAARGAMFKITASADRAFNRVTLETSAFYLLAFEPEPADRDGKPHNIRVRVQRPNVSVRSRAEFVVGGAPRSVRSAEEEVTSLLQSPVLASGLPLRVGTFTLRDAATLKPRVLVAVDIARGVTAPAAVAVGYAVVDGTGAPVGSYVKTESLKPFGIGDEACWKHAQAMLLNPGDYTLKFAAVDPQRRRGSVENRMTVGIQRAGSAQVSDLLLLDPSGEGPGGSNPAISGTITTDAVTMYLEVYSAQAGRPGKATATFEVAGTAAGAAMFTRQSAVAVKADDELWVVAGTVELPLLPPGDYVARVQLAVDGRAVARATRLFHLALRMVAGASPRARASFRDAGAFVRAFDRDSVLRPDVIRYFVRRMADVGGPTAAPAVVAAIAHAESKAFDEVLRDLEGADADQLAVPFLRGLARFAAGDLGSAGKEFRGSLLISSEFLPAAFYLGACYAAGGRDGEAVGAWQTALITESEAPIVYDMLADAFIRLRDTARARAIIDEARGKWPDDDLLVPRLAATHALDGRTADALKELSAYLERHANDEQALFLALRLLFDAHAAGGVVRSDAEDRADLARFAKLYEATAGVNKEIVARWVAFVESRKR